MQLDLGVCRLHQLSQVRSIRWPPSRILFSGYQQYRTSPQRFDGAGSIGRLRAKQDCACNQMRVVDQESCRCDRAAGIPDQKWCGFMPFGDGHQKRGQFLTSRRQIGRVDGPIGASAEEGERSVVLLLTSRKIAGMCWCDLPSQASERGFVARASVKEDHRLERSLSPPADREIAADRDRFGVVTRQIPPSRRP